MILTKMNGHFDLLHFDVMNIIFNKIDLYQKIQINMTNKQFYLFFPNEIYNNHLSLCKHILTNTQVNENVLSFHIYHKNKKYESYVDDIYYYVKLCSQNISRINLLQKIYASVSHHYFSKKSNDMVKITDLIISNAVDIQYIKKFCHHCATLNDQMIQYCHNYEILSEYTMYDRTPMYLSFIKAPNYNNCAMLKILLERVKQNSLYPNGISKLIYNCDSEKLWSHYRDPSLNKYQQFDTLLYQYVIGYQDLLIEYVDKMFLYFCKNMDYMIFIKYMEQHIHLFSKLSIDTGLYFCKTNVDGNKIIAWLNEKTKVQ
jgi:hypothetical protein